MCRERCISVISFIHDSLRNVNQRIWLRKNKVYGILLGAPRPEKVIVPEQTKFGQQFSDGTRQEHPTKFFTKILRLKQKTKRYITVHYFAVV